MQTLSSDFSSYLDPLVVFGGIRAIDLAARAGDSLLPKRIAGQGVVKRELTTERGRFLLRLQRETDLSSSTDTYSKPSATEADTIPFFPGRCRPICTVQMIVIDAASTSLAFVTLGEPLAAELLPVTTALSSISVIPVGQPASSALGSETTLAGWQHSGWWFLIQFNIDLWLIFDYKDSYDSTSIAKAKQNPKVVRLTPVNDIVFSSGITGRPDAASVARGYAPSPPTVT